MPVSLLHGLFSKEINCHIFFHKDLRRTVVVPVHGNKDIPKGTFMSILKQAGLSKDDLK